MVEIQNNVDFWTSDYLEISFLAGEQPVVLWMERTIAVSFPLVLCAARYWAGGASQAYLLTPIDVSIIPATERS